MVPRQQLLGDAVAIVVGQHMHRAIHPHVRQQRLLQVSLLQQPVVMTTRLGGVAETQQVTSDDAEAPRQRFPEVVPVPGRSGEAVDQQQRFALPRRPVADALATEVHVLCLGAPVAQGNAGQAGHCA